MRVLRTESSVLESTKVLTLSLLEGRNELSKEKSFHFGINSFK